MKVHLHTLRICLLSLLLPLCASAMAQVTLPTYTCYIKYDHDPAGNRTSKYWYCCCDAESFASDADTTGLKNALSLEHPLENLTLQLFPNPASDRLTVAVSGDLEQARYDIHDSQGRSVQHGPFKGSRMDIALSQLSPGLYNLRLIHNDEMLVRQFIVE